ncbi:MAG: glycoside hydrolase family 2 TIM barrel-domain containing protein [Bacteroidales bacterium]
MKAIKFTIGILSAIILFFFNSCESNKVDNQNLRTTSFDEEWLFINGNPTGAEMVNFNDSNWRKLDLPHDWSIEDLPGQGGDTVIGPFSKSSIGKMGTGYTIGGTAWYRKWFSIDPQDKDKIAYLQFDGIYMNADIWINGKHLGNHPYGYTSFYYDITPFLNPAGEKNLVAVQVKNEGRNARWYSGSGIYRHAWLTLVNPLHFDIWGIAVTTPVVDAKSSNVAVSINIQNKTSQIQNFEVGLQITDNLGQIVGDTNNKVSLTNNATVKLSQSVSINNPALWSIENPNLYSANISIFQNEKVIDRVSVKFGIRQIKFSTSEGFMLNGEKIELRGGCFHHDNGPLGSAAIDRAEERKIELLKKAGFNAIRCSHNPPSPYLLDVCDRLGMLVIDEFVDMWERSKISPDDYSAYFKSNWKKDITSMVLRDRNHPSVMMWSIGNEIPEATDTSAVRIAENLTSAIREIDSTRAITEAMVDMELFATGKSGWKKQAKHMSLLDVVGYNYGYDKYEIDHQKYPERIIFASESMPLFSFENWTMNEKLPYVLGNFTWTAMDYLGEAGVGYPRNVPVRGNNSSNPMAGLMVFFNPDSWPIFNDYQGDLDLIGNPKVPYYYQHVVWRESKVEMFVHRPVPEGMKEMVSPWGFPDLLKSWNWKGYEGKKLQVYVYTRCQLVKLELNGKPVGEQKMDENKTITAVFEVPYEEGSLIARCFDKDGNEIASQTLKTLGSPYELRLTADRTLIKPGLNDLSYIMAEVVDKEGNVLPFADGIDVNFEISGKGKLAGVGNGNPADISSFQQPHKKTYQGKCLLIIKPEKTPGEIKVIAKADGLKEASVIVKSE